MPFQFRRLIFGSPIKSEHLGHAKLPIILALPIFASDALSSVAYASETILRQLTSMGVAQKFWGVSVPISVAIVTLILMVVVSYRQVIYAYPHGGGSYVVAKENLGVMMGLIAASALLVDYVLTVAVSIADCVAQTRSAAGVINPSAALAFDHKVLIAVGLVLVIMLANLRGVRESGALFAGPSYGFIAVIFTMLAVGTYRMFFAGGAPVEPVQMSFNPALTHGIDWLVILRGFASGCAALTGIEAISNGVSAFKEPTARNATLTLGILGVMLACMFVGITYLAHGFGIGPSENETVVSQIARASFGTTMPAGVMYYLVQIFTALILFLAANTAFAGFPRLAAILAEDRFLPRQLAAIGDRLAYNNGIIVLSALAMLFLIVFQGEAHALLPLYTIGVFIAFSTAQLGMVVRARREKGPVTGLVINLVGAIITFVVLVVITVSKFIAFDQHPLFGTRWFYEGAWMALVLMGLVVWLFSGIKRHYDRVDHDLASIPPEARKPFVHKVIVLVPARIHRGIVQAVNYAKSLSPDAVAVHIAFDSERASGLRTAWESEFGETLLIVLDSPYRSLYQPLMQYLDAAEKVHHDDLITVILPEFVPARWWHNFLHNASGWLLRLRLFYRKEIVIVSIRYYLSA
jgi:amino acid transporter